MALILWSNLMNNIFYCYSKNMAHFIMAFGIRYISYAKNRKTNTPYYTFEKSERLDAIIRLYKSVIHSV